jgi:hypothetical protein
MKNNLNIKINQLYRLQGKPKFMVIDLIKILENLDDNTEIKFGILTENKNIQHIKFTENFNLIFRLSQDTNKNNLNNNYILEIITDGNGFH